MEFTTWKEIYQISLKNTSGRMDGQSVENSNMSPGIMVRERVNPCYLTDSAVIMGMSNNKLRKIIHRNRREGNTALCLHWNSGSAYLENKMDHIRDIIGRYKPVVIGISEANLRYGIDMLEARVNGYDMLYLNALNNENINMSFYHI